jgi:C-terminal processing protease CtpA/Prc
MLIRKLPNGWYATLSNEVYFDANGNKLETAGIKPDIEVPMDLAAARQGRDPALEAIRARESAR